MGASAREIERQIEETRARMDTNLNRLEDKAQSSAVRYGKIAGVVLGAAVLGGLALLIYRRTHRPTLRDRLPSVTVRVNEKTEEEPGTVESIIRKVAPALAGTAGSALLSRIAAMPEEDAATAPRP